MTASHPDSAIQIATRQWPVWASLRDARDELMFFRNAPDSCRKCVVPALTFSARSGHSLIWRRTDGIDRGCVKTPLLPENRRAQHDFRLSTLLWSVRMLENPAKIGMTRRLLGKFDSEFPMTNQKLLHRKNLMLHCDKTNTMLG